MAKPYSNDLRRKMVASVQSGVSRRRTAELFHVSVSCVIKLMQRSEATGDVAPARFGGFKVSPLAGREADICKWIGGNAPISPLRNSRTNSQPVTRPSALRP